MSLPKGTSFTSLNQWPTAQDVTVPISLLAGLYPMLTSPGEDLSLLGYYSKHPERKKATNKQVHNNREKRKQ